MPGNLRVVPVEVYLSWPTPNYVDPVRRSWMPIFAGVFQGATTVLVVTRLWLRLSNQAGQVGLDDAFLVPAFLSSTMFTTIAILACSRYGSDRHTWDLPISLHEPGALMAWLAQLSFLASTSFTKISVLLFYRRLVKGTYNRVWRYMTIGAIIFTALYGSGFIISLVVNCSPTEAYWRAYDPYYTTDWHCTDTTYLNPIAGALSVVSDIYSVILPMAIVRNFDIARRKKLALYAVFSLGLLGAAAGCVRAYYLTRLGTEYDQFWIGFDVLLWSDLECQLAIICASIPVLRVLFRRYLQGPLSRFTHSSSHGRSTTQGSVQVVRQTIVTDVHELDVRQGFKHNATRSLEKVLADEMDVDDGFKHNATPALRTISEDFSDTEIKKAPASRPAIYDTDDADAISTPEQYEEYTLRNLNKYRPTPRRHAFVREESYERRTGRSGSQRSTDLKTPMSWLDVGEGR